MNETILLLDKVNYYRELCDALIIANAHQDTSHIHQLSEKMAEVKAEIDQLHEKVKDKI